MAEQSPDPWRLAWRVVTSDEVLVALLLAIAISLTLTAWIPQQPSSDVDYARWLSQMQAQFGEITSALRGLGLFHVISSLGFRGLLALLSMCLLLRLIEGLGRLAADQQAEEPDGSWQEVSDWPWSELLDSLRRRRYRLVDASSFFQVDRWPWGGVLPLAAHGGALVLLVSLVLSHSLGWQAKSLILQHGDQQSLAGGEAWVKLPEDGDGVQSSPNVVAFVEDHGPGVLVRAVADDAQPLQLILTPSAEPSTELKIALAEDAYFALPEAELVVRLTPRSQEPFTRMDVQIYSSPTGEIIAERVTEEGGEGTFNVAGVTLAMVPAPYARLTATRNPGRLPAGVGVVLLLVGLMASLAWSDHRFWLRQNGDAIEVAGPIPAWLRDEEGRL